VVVSLVGIALLAAAVLLLCAMEWPRIARIVPEMKTPRKRRRRKTHLRVDQNDDESDEFARSVQRDLANLPTIDERDRRR